MYLQDSAVAYGPGTKGTHQPVYKWSPDPWLLYQDSQAVCRVSKHPLLLKQNKNKKTKKRVIEQQVLVH